MSLVNLNVSCGCGAKYTTIKDALTHAVTKEHSMTISGLINPKASQLSHAEEGTNATKQVAGAS